MKQNAKYQPPIIFRAWYAQIAIIFIMKTQKSFVAHWSYINTVYCYVAARLSHNMAYGRCPQALWKMAKPWQKVRREKALKRRRQSSPIRIYIASMIFLISGKSIV